MSLGPTTPRSGCLHHDWVPYLASVSFDLHLASVAPLQAPEKETKPGVLKVHLPDLVVGDHEQRPRLLAHHGLRATVVPRQQAKLAHEIALPQDHVGLDRAKAPVEHEQDLRGRVTLAKERLPARTALRREKGLSHSIESRLAELASLICRVSFSNCRRRHTFKGNRARWSRSTG